MDSTQVTATRRSFLWGWIRSLIATPVAMASLAPARAEEQATEEQDELLPGDPGYRDPETYGSLADYDQEGL